MRIGVQGRHSKGVMRKEDQERAVVEVVSRVVEAVRLETAAGGPSVEEVAADVLYNERAVDGAADAGDGGNADYHRDAAAVVGTQQVELVREMAERFAREVVGPGPAVYADDRPPGRRGDRAMRFAARSACRACPTWATRSRSAGRSTRCARWRRRGP